MGKNVNEIADELSNRNRGNFAADVEAAREFHGALIQVENENDRLYSWEHCYTEFSKARLERNLSDMDKDRLALHLAFYLASWGMYRGSSFLLQRDYRVHREAVDIILKYGSLSEVQIGALDSARIDEFVEALFKLYGELESHYKKIRSDVLEQWGKNTKRESVSATLITKIMMGALGCVPAYDRFVVGALGGYKLTKRFSEKSIRDVIKLVQNNRHEFEELWRGFKRPLKGKGSGRYPQMKLVDFVLWTKGFLDDLKNGETGVGRAKGYVEE